MVCNFCGRLILKKKKADELAEKLKYAGIKKDPYSYIGFRFLLFLLLSLLFAYITYYFLNNLIYAVAVFLFSEISLFVIDSVLLSLMISKRARYAEEVLPDILLIMSSNLRSGVPTDEAFILSAHDEFGFVAEKIRKIGKKLATGVPIDEALSILTEDVKSKLLERTVNLIVEGIKSGGELAPLLETLAADIRDNSMLKKEIESMLVIYALYTVLAIVVIAPVLYAVSLQLSSILTKMSTAFSYELTSKKAVAVALKPSEISPDFMRFFALLNLVITGTFGSLMLGLIKTGDEKEGVKYIPFILVVSLLLFVASSYIFGSFFGSLHFS